jgi:hypothetical protein
MLYEMVCGRPPFVGDESVAIIGQHLNTPPVSPRWHREDCPPALEAIILRLLEKDPGKRPGSAAEVREALASITMSASNITASPVSTAAPSYRRTFVGRDAEVKQLQQAFDAAISGDGGLVMIAGEPGVGKTAISEQLATYVALRGGKTLVGHCYEEGSLSLPYLPFVEAMRSHVLSRDAEELRAELGTGAGDVARIVSEVRDRVQVELRPAGDADDDRWRLLQAVTTFLRNAGNLQPLVLVLEDLHWSDRGTLDLLLHVARNLSGARLLVVGTYRDVEVDRSHPLSGTLADLRRLDGFQRISLRGLTAQEVQRMMSSLAGQEITWTTAEAVYRQTEGNPLFVQEVQRYLIEEGLIVREAGRWRAASDTQPIAMSIPEGLRDVIGKRLTRLTPECNRILAVAAVIGRDFELQTLQSISQLDEESVVSAVEEAEKVGILQDQSRPGSIRYRFAHAFFRQTLYEELSAPRRLRLHQEVARALEVQYARRLEEHAAELAEHFSHSTDASDLQKAVQYGRQAAQRAVEVFDFGEAERLLLRAIEAQEVFNDGDFSLLSRLYQDLGNAVLYLDQPMRVGDEIAKQALELAERGGDAALAAEACHLALVAYDRHSRTQVPASAVSWLEIAEKYAREGTADRIYIDLARIKVLYFEGRVEGARQLLRSTFETARAAGSNEAFYRIAAQRIGSSSRPEDAEENAEIAREVLARPRSNVRASTLVYTLRCCANALQTVGTREYEQTIWAEIDELGRRSMDPSILDEVTGHRLQQAFFDGRLEDAAAEVRALRAQGIRSQGTVSQAITIAAVLGVRPLLYLGLYDEALEAVGYSRPVMQRNLGHLALAHAGLHSEALDAFQSQLALAERRLLTGQGLSASLETATILKLHDALPELIDALRPSAGHITNSEISCAGRHLGAASHLLGNATEARAFYGQALDVATRTRFRPEVALIRLHIAELFLDLYPDERDTAIEHLDFAIGEFQAMKMQPALERALGHRGLLKA